MARRDSVGIRLITRRGNDWSDRFPLVVEAVTHLKVRSILIDGEAVCCDERGLSRFDVLRRPEHQAFGAGGRHFCLGASLARLELKLLFEETLRRFPDMQLAGEPTRARSLFLNQLKTLPVKYTPES